MNLNFQARKIYFYYISNDPDAGKDWGQEEKGTTEDEMVGWHLRLDGQGFRWTPGVDYGRGGLACCRSWGRKESDMNWADTLYKKNLKIFEIRKGRKTVPPPKDNLLFIFSLFTSFFSSDNFKGCFSVLDRPSITKATDWVI